MLRWISFVRGLLIMMGEHDRSEALFYYFRLEDQVPETHLLRLIEKHIFICPEGKPLKIRGHQSAQPHSPFIRP